MKDEPLPRRTIYKRSTKFPAARMTNPSTTMIQGTGPGKTALATRRTITPIKTTTTETQNVISLAGLYPFERIEEAE
jgi:hypothetical protein